MKNIQISIVIPVYNEEKHIRRCLDSIALQQRPPYEVIVVDNNSTDNTAAIARDYPFVRVIREEKQGVVHARNRGFDSARGSIIARIDADSQLSDDWTMQIVRIFHTKKVSAVTGSISYYDVPGKQLIAAIDLMVRRQSARLMKDKVFLQGANMALRRSAWKSIKPHVCNRGGLHEDFDLAIHLREQGHVVIFDEWLQVSISARFIDDTTRSFRRYALLNPGTYTQHNTRTGYFMYLLVLCGLIFHIPLRAVYRGYDVNSRTFIWEKALRRTWTRHNPATFVD